MALLIIKNPENMNLIKEQDLKLFSEQIIEVINCLKNNKKNDKINYLALKAEIEPVLDEVSLGQEFNDCFKELKTLVLKSKLNNISKEIKKAEQEKDSKKVQDLMQQFNQGAKLLETI